ncbi:MAG TPA: MarR family transcriptional regulator [Solirubrobacteraceae bacterium]|jgi:DNA-binding MarR family transcriptional regulator|nr:MarR family transcriptional regulator [Solirubrobacteraceae bacterium]
MWDGGPIPAELRVFPGYLLARLGDASRRRFHHALAPEGLHPRHFGVLSIVAAKPGLSQQQLHEHTGIDPSSMVAVIDELEVRGLVARTPRRDDRRVRAIVLTDEGKQTLARVRKLAGTLQREMFGALSAEELRTLHGLLQKLANVDASESSPPATEAAAGRVGA